MTPVDATEFAPARVEPQMPRTGMRALVPMLATLLSILLLRSAWGAEDAYISFRVLDNLLHGYGLRWNIADRVQTYTDPLFLAIVTAATAISGNVYLSAILVSLAISLAAYFVAMRGASPVGILTATVALVFSKAFVDFSISGMENPLTHLLVAAYLAAWWRKRDPFVLSLIAALAATNRMDSLLFFLPSLLLVYWRLGLRVWRPALLGWTPFLGWSLFALFYYGFLFPNTAYAKLHTGIPVRDLIFQGIAYYNNALAEDTATLFVIALGLVVAYLAREWALGIGILLNLIYILRVGGDFMMGRFFSGALFLSAMLIARYWRPHWGLASGTMLAIAALGMWIPRPTILSASADYGVKWPLDVHGIADERAYYYPEAGFLRYRREVLWPAHYLAVNGTDFKRRHMRALVYGNIGMAGYWAGPEVHMIDILGLGDPLLARLPLAENKWRIGHYFRSLPDGYFETLATGHNYIEDAQLHEYWEHLHPVVSGDLWSFRRLIEIFKFNTGQYEHLLPHGIPSAAAPAS